MKEFCKSRVDCPVFFDTGDMLYGDWTYSRVPAFMGIKGPTQCSMGK